MLARQTLSLFLAAFKSPRYNFELFIFGLIAENLGVLSSTTSLFVRIPCMSPRVFVLPVRGTSMVTLFSDDAG
jgi:hypothetical protein